MFQISNHLVRSRTTRAAVAVAVALALIGCGSNSGKGAEQLTVEEQLGLGQDGIQQRQIRAESLIRDCMKAQGFDYVPVDAGALRAAYTGQADLSPEDFNKQFGYGITTLFTQQRQTAVGPNEQIRAALSPADQAAYDLALRGDQGGSFFQATDSGDFSQLGGCTKSATEDAFGGAALLTSIQAALDELDQRVANDSRMVKAVAAWSTCMHEQGFDLAEPGQVDETLRQRLAAIVGADAARGNVTAPLADYDAAALTTLQQDEVRLVAADIDCEHKNITDVEDKVRAEADKAFRSEGADVLSKVPTP